MAISNALERPAGQHATRCAVSIGAVAGTFLSVARYPQTATQVACVAFVCMCVVVQLAVWKCGRSLLGTIDQSMLQNSPSPSMPSARHAAGTEEKGRERRLDYLVAARKNIRMASSFCLVLGSGTIGILFFSVSSPLGMFAPLLFFATPMVRARHRLALGMVCCCGNG